MFTPEKMQQVLVVFSDKDVNRVADAVVRQGSLQIVDAADMEEWAHDLPKGGTGEETGEMKVYRERVENIMKNLGLAFSAEHAVLNEGPWEGLDRRITDVEHSLKADLSVLEETEKELARLKELRDHLETVPVLGLPLRGQDAYSYLSVEVGSVSQKNMAILQQNLASVLHVVYPLGEKKGMVQVVVLVLKQDQERLRSALREAGFQPADVKEKGEVPSPEVVKKLDQEIVRFQNIKNSAEERRKKMAQEEGPFFQSVLLRIRRDNLKQHILKYFRKTERTYLLSGWVPSEEREAFVGEIKRITQNRCIVEDNPAETIASVREGKVQVPVQLKNPSLLKPFEILTKMYGIPSYLSIDPTPLLGISFLIMFGIMFGDGGHGLVLSILGGLLAVKGKRQTYKNAGLLLFYAGCTSMLFGVLFGSIFGVENLLPTLWMKPMRSISHLFRVAIFFGIGMITVAIGVNIANGIRKRDFLGLIFDKAGLLAAVLYWCGIVVATRVITAEAGGEVPALVPILMLSSIVLLFLREPIMHLVQGKRRLFPEGVATGIMGSSVELLEIFLGFLANTVSFIRVAAFGLAHAGLFMAIFALSDAVKEVASGFVSILVLIVGNLLIIGLEGLVVSIQAVRLEFYEFFSRFFQSGSLGYRPLGSEMKA